MDEKHATNKVASQLEQCDTDDKRSIKMNNILITGQADIDFSDKNDSEPVANNTIVNVSDTSSSDLESYKHIDNKLEFNQIDESTIKVSEETLRNQRAGKTILKNKIDANFENSPKTNMDCKNTDINNGRSIEINIHKNFSTLYDFPTKKEKKLIEIPNAESSKQNSFHYEENCLSVHDDCCNQCDILKCPCHHYLMPSDNFFPQTSGSAFNFSTNKTCNNDSAKLKAFNSYNKNKTIEKVTFDDVNISATTTNSNNANQKPRYIQALQCNSQQQASKDFLLAKQMNCQPISLSYTANATSEAMPVILPRYASNVRIGDRHKEENNSQGKLRRPRSLALNLRTPHFKQSKTLDSFDINCHGKVANSGPFCNGDLYNHMECGPSSESLVHKKFIDEHSQENIYFKSNYHPRSDYDLKLMASLRNNERKASANKESSGTDSDAIYNYDLYKLQSSKSSHRHHKHRNKSHRKHQCRSESYRTAEEEEKKKKRSSSCSYKLYKDQQQLMEESAFDGQNMLVNYSNENLVNRPKQPYFYHNEPASSQTYLDQINGGHLLCSNNMMNNHKNYNNNKAKNITFNLPTQNQKALRHSYTYDQFPNSNYFDSNYIQVQSQQVNQLNYLKASFSNNDSLGKLANMSGANKHQEIIAVSKEANNPYIILRPAGINSGKGGRILIPRSKSSMPGLATTKKATALEGQQRKPGPHAANYSDLVAANASFIDSPIHLLMNHHENQRLLKQQTKELTNKTRTPGQNCVGNEGENAKPRAKNHEQKIRFEFDYPAERMTRNISAQNLNGVSTVIEIPDKTPPNQSSTVIKNENQDPVIVEEYSPKLKQQKQHKFIALLLITTLTISSIYVFEILSCLVRTNIIHLVTYQLSIILTCFGFMSIISSRFYWRRCKMTANDDQERSNQELENENFYNIFRVNTFKSPKKPPITEDDELKDLMDIANQKNTCPAEFFSVKTTIFAKRSINSSSLPISISLILINSWILSTYTYWYFETKNSLLSKQLLDTFKAIPNWVEMLTSVLGGFGTAVLIKVVIFDLFELNFNLNDLNIGFFVSNETRRELANWDNSKLAVLNMVNKQRNIMLNIYRKILLKFLVVVQSHWIITVGFLVYIFKVKSESSLDGLLSHLCYKFEMASKKSHLCFETFISENIIAWKNEIVFRSKLAMNAGELATKNQTISYLDKIKSNGDVYLLLTSVGVLNFLLSFLVIVFLTGRQPLHKSGMNKDTSNNTNAARISEGNSFLKIDKSTVFSAANRQKISNLAMLHSVMPLVFFQGYIKTLLINELIKIYVVCLNGSDHLLKLLLSFGCSSFMSIIILALLIIICNLKRSVMFFLILVQQSTLIVLLFYWDPSRSNDIKTYYIGYIYFICFAICNNLWLTHNLKTLLDKSHELNKSPSVVLFYAYAIFCLGTLIGYVSSVYLCTTIKLYLTLILLILFSALYVILEMVFHFKKK